MRSLLALAVLALGIPALAAASEFDGLVSAFERETGAHATHIPFFGLARFVVAVAHPAGASDLRLAVFEHVNARPLDFAKVADGVVGGAWKRIVRVQSRRGESTNIYTREEGTRLRLLIATVDGGDATFVEMRLQPEALLKFIDEHGH